MQEKTEYTKEEMFDAVYSYWRWKNDINVNQSTFRQYAEWLYSGYTEYGGNEKHIQKVVDELETGKKLWEQGYRIGFNQLRQTVVGEPNRDREWEFAKCLEMGYIATAQAYKWHYLIKE